MFADNQKKAINRSRDYLKTQGYQLQSEPELIRQMPWSTVYCFKSLSHQSI